MNSFSTKLKKYKEILSTFSYSYIFRILSLGLTKWIIFFIPFEGEAAPQGEPFQMELPLGRTMIWTQEYLIGELLLEPLTRSFMMDRELFIYKSSFTYISN